MPFPEIRPLLLTTFTTPDWHPLPNTELPVYGFLVIHDDGPLLVDTGVGSGNAFIDEQYQPRNADLDELLAREGVAVEDIVAVANSHLHFDHSGNNTRFSGTPIYVQRAEFEASREPRYTIPEWVAHDALDYRQLDGDHDLAEGVRLLSTPGHTPGHQSALVETARGLEAIVAQAAEDFADYEARVTTDESLQRIAALKPRWLHFGHGPSVELGA
jgi:N-acyl homoserine lactone hydrolase